jgi:tetratricopeptide (TPR) repeat protein
MRSIALVMSGVVVGACWPALPVVASAPSTLQSPIDARSALAVVAERADVAYRAGDWKSALPLYRRLTREQPDGYLNWLRLGACLHGVGENTQALAAYARARINGAPPSNVQYQVALVFAAMGSTEKALAVLTEAVKQGHGRPDLMNSAADFASLRGDPRFDGLLRQAENNQTPCDHRGESRQFDFWVGDWSVVSTRELTPVGHSHIERTIGNCVIWENWTSLGDSGYSGKSYNIFNAELNRWEQFWVDSQGEVIHFFGSLAAGVMDFRTGAMPGKALIRRLRFYNLGADRVRQLSEGSEDGGKTWTVEYDFTYKREH